MTFTSPMEEFFVESEIGDLLCRARASQVNYLLGKISNFTYDEENIDKIIINNLMPENTPEILLRRRQRIKALKHGKKRRI